MREVTAAIAMFEAGLETFRSARYTLGVAFVMGNLGRARQREGREENAHGRWRSSAERVQPRSPLPVPLTTSSRYQRRPISTNRNRLASRRP